MSDEEIIDKILVSGDKKLFSTLHERYRKKVYAKCLSFTRNSEESKDLTQEIFLKLYSKLDGYQGRSMFSTWLYSFTYNFLVNHVKKDHSMKLRDRWERLNAREHDKILIEDEEEELWELQISRLEESLDRLEPADKAIILMKYQDNFTVKDIQLLLDVSESAVKMRLKRARQKLIHLYRKDQP